MFDLKYTENMQTFLLTNSTNFHLLDTYQVLLICWLFFPPRIWKICLWQVNEYQRNILNTSRIIYAFTNIHHIELHLPLPGNLSLGHKL